jgi:hypothetical protein
MKNILLVLIFGFLSCGQEKRIQANSNVNKDTTLQVSYNHKPETAFNHNADSIFYEKIIPDSILQKSPDYIAQPYTHYINHIYSSTLYKKVIPDSVFLLINKYLPRWKFPAPSKFETFFSMITIKKKIPS